MNMIALIMALSVVGICCVITLAIIGLIYFSLLLFGNWGIILSVGVILIVLTIVIYFSAKDELKRRK